MEVGRRPPMHRCDCCYMTCAEGIDFQKIVESEDIGITIYRYVPQTQDALQKTDGEVFVLQNKKNDKVTSQDLAAVFEQNVVSCPRCLKIIERADNFLKNVPLRDREDVMGICNHCVRKQRPLSSICKCQDIVDKFLWEDPDQRKRQIKTWLKRVQDQFMETTLDTRQNDTLKTRTQSEISLKTALSQFSKSEHKYFIEGHPESQLGADRRLKSHVPRSSRSTTAFSSSDRLHDTEKMFKTKEFDALFAPLRYPKQKYYDQIGIPLISAKQTPNKVTDIGPAPENVQFKEAEATTAALPTVGKVTQSVPECVLVDPQEYIKRAMSLVIADETKVCPELIGKDSLLNFPTKKEINTKFGFFKLPEDNQLSDKVLVGKKIQPFDVGSLYEAPKENKAKIKLKKTSILKSHETARQELSSSLLDASVPGRGRQKMSSPPVPKKKHLKEFFYKDTPEKGVTRVFSYSFPKERVTIKRQVSSSELIKNTQDKLQAKAEEEKRKKEKELKSKRGEEERKNNEQEIKRKQALAAKLAKAQEEKRRQAEEEKNKKMEEEIRRENGKHKQSENKKALEDEKNKRLKEQDILNEKLIKPKTTPISPQSSMHKSEKEKRGAASQKVKQINEKQASRVEKDKTSREKKGKQEYDKLADQGRLKKDGEERQKDVVEKEFKNTKDDNGNDGKLSTPAKKGDPEDVAKQTKPDKTIKDKNGNKQTKPDREKKSENEPSKTVEPKAKNDTNNKLEDNKLMALLASQKKEKQTQDFFLKEQQRADELLREKASEAAKPGNHGDKNAKDEAANKLKKNVESTKASEPSPPKKKEEAPNTKEIAIKEVKMKRPSTGDMMLQLVKLKKDENCDNKVSLSNINPIVLNEHGKRHQKNKRAGCIICTDSDLALQFEELIEEKKSLVDAVMNDVIIGEKIFKFKAPFKLPHDEPIVELKDIQETPEPKPTSSPTHAIKKNEVVRLYEGSTVDVKDIEHGSYGLSDENMFAQA